MKIYIIITIYIYIFFKFILYKSIGWYMQIPTQTILLPEYLYGKIRHISNLPH